MPLVANSSRLKPPILLFMLVLLCAACAQQPAAPTSTIAPPPAYPQSDSLPIRQGIRVVFQDSRGHYWLGSDEEGACRFDGKQFVHFATAHGLAGNQVTTIQEGADGTIWLGTNKGLSCFRGGEMFVVEVPTPLPGAAQNWELVPGDIWMGVGNTIDVIRIRNGVASAMPHPNAQEGTKLSGDWGVTDISVGGDGQIWIARYNRASGFDGQRWTHIHDSTLHYDGNTDYLHVRSILSDSKGRLWVGNNGIGVLLREQGTTTNFSKANGLYQGTPQTYPAAPGTLMHVFAIAEDSQGHIWFGDRDTGAWRFDGKHMQHFIIDAALSSQHIWDIYEDRAGTLLVAMGAGGVYRFDGHGFVRKF